MGKQEDGAKKPLFTLELDSNGGTFAPYTVADIALWLETEIAFWSWLSEQNLGGPARNFITPVVNHLGVLNTQAQQAGQNLGAHVTFLTSIQANLDSLYLHKKLPHSRSLLGHRVDEIRMASPVRALHYLHARLMNPKSDPVHLEGGSLEALAGYLVGIQDRFDLQNNADGVTFASQHAFNRVLSEAEKQLSTSRQMNEFQQNHFKAMLTSISKAEQGQSEAFALQAQTQSQLFERSQATREDSHKALEDALRKQMALREPVRYWSQRARIHEKAAKIWSRYLWWAFPLLALVTGVFAFEAFRDGMKPDPTISAVALVVGAIGFWGTRLIVRMYLSHHHLKLDAEERQTMIMTYLALASDGQLPDSDDKKLVLAPLFRPASDGVVKEDGVVLPGLEAFSRIPGSK